MSIVEAMHIVVVIDITSNRKRVGLRVTRRNGQARKKKKSAAREQDAYENCITIYQRNKQCLSGPSHMPLDHDDAEIFISEGSRRFIDGR